MPEVKTVAWGSFPFTDDGGAAIVGDITVKDPVRTVGVAANALSKNPVQTVDFISDFGTISFRVRLGGIDTSGETAPRHLERMWSNLRTLAAKKSSTFTITIRGWSAPRSYGVVKSDSIDTIITVLTQTRSVIEADVVLKYL